jgi:hypothetical protein
MPLFKPEGSFSTTSRATGSKDQSLKTARSPLSTARRSTLDNTPENRLNRAHRITDGDRPFARRGRRNDQRRARFGTSRKRDHDNGPPRTVQAIGADHHGWPAFAELAADGWIERDPPNLPSPNRARIGQCGGSSSRPSPTVTVSQSVISAVSRESCSSATAAR